MRYKTLKDLRDATIQGAHRDTVIKVRETFTIAIDDGVILWESKPVNAMVEALQCLGLKARAG